jgi:hypothetical protein
MIFNDNSKYADSHAFLSPSKPQWMRYDLDKLARVFSTQMTAARGTRLHALAAELIEMGVKLPDNNKTLNAYVNDSIGWRMTPELTVFYSRNAYGRVDALGFRNNVLRINDLKNGVNATTIEQLRVYAALFCLEYKLRPFNIEIELRIYQNDRVKVERPDPDDIFKIMDQIVHFDEHIENWRKEML